MDRRRIVRLPNEPIHLYRGLCGWKLSVESKRHLYKGELLAVIELVNQTIKLKETKMKNNEILNAVREMHHCLEGVISEQGYESLQRLTKNPMMMMVNGDLALKALRKMNRTKKDGGAE